MVDYNGWTLTRDAAGFWLVSPGGSTRGPFMRPSAARTWAASNPAPARRPAVQRDSTKSSNHTTEKDA